MPPTPNALIQRCITRLDERRSQGLERHLPGEVVGVDFISNDYLGLARRLRERGGQAGVQSHAGATGSRLLSGDSREARDLELFLAEFHQAQAALLFGSGYAANLGILQALCERGDCVLYDQYCHASIREGLRLSFARCFGFGHNDLVHLEKLLQRHATRTSRSARKGLVWIVIESLYSMDGDCAPLAALCELAERYSAQLIVDEAHATGLFGPQGQGLVQALGLEARVAVRMHSFGKAIGYHGAAALASSEVIQVLVNFARSFIYTTALPFAACSVIHESYQELSAAAARKQLQLLVEHFTRAVAGDALLKRMVPPRPGPIQIVLCPGNREACALAEALRERGFCIRAVLSPTVPKGSERLRVILHAFNSMQQLDALLSAVIELYPQEQLSKVLIEPLDSSEQAHAAT